MSRLVYKTPPINLLPIGAGLLQSLTTGILSVDGIAPTPLSGAALSTDVTLLLRNTGTTAAPVWVPFYATQAQVEAWAGSSSSGSSGSSGSTTGTPYAGPNVLALSASGTGTATTPYQAAFLSQSLASLSIRVKVAASALSASTSNISRIVSCFGNGFSGWVFYVDNNGFPGIAYADTAANNISTAYVPTAFSVSASTPTWIGIDYVFTGTNALSLGAVQSPDGVNYSQVGNLTSMQSGIASLVIGSNPLQIGPASDSLLQPNTHILAVQVIANGTKVVDVDFTNAAVGATTVTASTGQVFTVIAPAAIAA